MKDWMLKTGIVLISSVMVIIVICAFWLATGGVSLMFILATVAVLTLLCMAISVKIR